MKKYIFIIYSLILATSCSNEQVKTQASESEINDLIEISEAQFKQAKMELGNPEVMQFDSEVTCNGYVSASANGLAKVNTQLSGIVESINVSIGDYVKKGQVICTLSSNEFISLQENFTVASAKLKVAKKNFERSKELYKENVGSEMEFNNAESEYKTLLANYNSFKTRLKMMKLNVSNIEDGKPYSLLPIYAPINGYITNRTIVLGDFIDAQKGLMEIVDNKKLQLVLSVFGEDLNSLKEGQEVKFTTVGNFDKSFSATLSTVGRAINEETKTIQCIAKIKDLKDYNFVNKTYVEARILVDKKDVLSVPTQSIVKIGKNRYVLALEKKDNGNYLFKKVKVRIRNKYNGYTAIYKVEGLNNILIKGVYNLSVGN